MTSDCAQRRHFSSLLLALVLLLAPSAAPVSAALSPHASFDVSIDGCFDGHGPANAPVLVYWRRANGHLKSSWQDTTNDSGYFYPPQAVCNAVRAQAGDTIRAVFPSEGPYIRRLTVPALTLDVDRLTSVVSGVAPANTTLQLGVLRPWLGSFGFGQFSCATTATTTSHGTYTRNFRNVSGGSGCPAHYKARGNDEFSVVYTDAATGDTIYRSGIAPFVSVSIGAAAVGGAVHAGASVTVRDRSSTGVLRGTAVGKGSLSGWFHATLKNGASTKVVRVGDRIDGNWAGNVSFVVPKLVITWDSVANSLRGRCLPNAEYGLSLSYDNGSTSAVSGVTDAHGMTRILDGQSHTIAAGDVARLVCARSSGDQIIREVTL